MTITYSCIANGRVVLADLALTGGSYQVPLGRHRRLYACSSSRVAPAEPAPPDAALRGGPEQAVSRDERPGSRERARPRARRACEAVSPGREPLQLQSSGAALAPPRG